MVLSYIHTYFYIYGTFIYSHILSYLWYFHEFINTFIFVVLSYKYIYKYVHTVTVRIDTPMHTENRKILFILPFTMSMQFFNFFCSFKYTRTDGWFDWIQQNILSRFRISIIYNLSTKYWMMLKIHLWSYL